MLGYGNESWLIKCSKNSLVYIPKRVERERVERVRDEKIRICNNILVRLTPNGPRSIANFQMFFIFRVDLYVPISDVRKMKE